jgi:hypothetical protein
MRQVHPVARTTPRTLTERRTQRRTQRRTSENSSAALAKRYKVSIATARKWKDREGPGKAGQGRDDAQGRSHRPHTLATTLSAAQELIVVELRRALLLPLDDLLVVTRAFINPAASRSGLDRRLRRHKVSQLTSLQPDIEGEIKPLNPHMTTYPPSCAARLEPSKPHPGTQAMADRQARMVRQARL